MQRILDGSLCELYVSAGGLPDFSEYSEKNKTPYPVTDKGL
jgi:hypothetical protein